LKVEHLLRAMFKNGGKFDDYLSPILSAFPPPDGTEMCLSNPGRGLAAALVQLAFEQLRATYESAKTDLAWLWPVIDSEDWDTYKDTLKNNPEKVFPCGMPSQYEEYIFTPQNGLFGNPKDLSIYGIFIYWGLLALKFQYEADKKISDEIIGIRNWCLEF